MQKKHYSTPSEAKHFQQNMPISSKLKKDSSNCSVLKNKTEESEPDERVGGPGQFLLEGPYDVIHDVIVCKSYIFAVSQSSRLFFFR